MEKEKSIQASKVSEMRRKFEDGEKPPQIGRKDKYRVDDVSALAGLAAVAKRRDKPVIKGSIINSSPFKTQLSRRSSASVEAANADVPQLKQELNANKFSPANCHAVARRTVSEFVLRKEHPEDAEPLNSNGEKPLTPVPIPRRRNAKKQSPNNTTTQGVSDRNVGDVLQRLDNGSRLSQSWLHESNDIIKTKPITDKIRRPLPELPSCEPLQFTPISDTSPNTNASRGRCSDINSPKVPCGGTSGGLVQQIVQGINSGSSPTLPSKSSNCAKMQTGNGDLVSPSFDCTDGESGHEGIELVGNPARSARFKSHNVQDAIRNLNSASTDVVAKPLPKGPPPDKPPRTFEYDMYLAKKALNLEPRDHSSSDEKNGVTFRETARNHVYDEVAEHRGGANTTKGSDNSMSNVIRRKSITSNKHDGSTIHPLSKTPPTPPPEFKRADDTPTKKPSTTKTPTVPYAVSKLQHRIISKFGQGIHFGHQHASSTPLRKSKFFVDLKKKFSPEHSQLSPKRSVSNEHIYDEPYMEPELCRPRQLVRSLSDEAISNPEYDSLSCKSGFSRPKPSAFNENVHFTNGCEHSATESGLHYMSTPILRKNRSNSYGECMVPAKPVVSRLHAKGWIKANCETPPPPLSRPTNNVAHRKFT